MVKKLMGASPNLFRRVGSMLYEAVLLFAILFVAGLLHRAIFGDPQTAWESHLLFMYLWIISGVYFVYCWTRSGQTLAMQTWRIKLLGVDGALLSLEQAIKRYAIATFSLMFFGFGFVWAWFDREGLYLHDRLTGGRLIFERKA